MDKTSWKVRDVSEIPSPALVFHLEFIRKNLQRMLLIAGSPDRLRPHMKTHKTREITRLYLESGIAKHKCATLREAEVLASCGVADILVAYPMVGPNVRLIARLAEHYPDTRFSVLGDNLETIAPLAEEMGRWKVNLGIYLDFNVGHNRTGAGVEQGLKLGREFLKQFESPFQTSGICLRGLHLYDGHNTALPISQRAALVDANFQQGITLRNALENAGAGELELVFGGTPAFPSYAGHQREPRVSISPGTCILHDAGYTERYPELGFEPAAAVLTRCIDRPGPKWVTFDVGTKAICSDPPAGQRCVVLGLEDAKALLHNEEHLVLESDRAESWSPGQATMAFPSHICPTVAMYDRAQILFQGDIGENWEIAARGRQLESV